MRISTLSLIAIATMLAALPASAQVSTYAKFDAEIPPGNLAVGPDGRVFMSVHEFYGKPLRVVEVLPNGVTRPYPNKQWAAAPEGDGPGLRGVLGLRADRSGILWMLDGQGPQHTGRVVGWDTRAERLYRVYYLGQPVANEEPFLNDLAVDRDREAIYISDTGNGKNSALIVLDLKTGQARRVLEGSRFTVPEDIDMVIDGRIVTLGGSPARIGVNPITVDPTNTWVYFAPMSGRSMYRVRTRDLLDESLTDELLANRVERYGDKPISDGSTVDAAGNVYITAITDDAIGVIRPDGSYEVLHQRDDLSWPDGFAIGVDGYIYATINELHRSAVLNNGVDTTQGEFKIIRFPALGETISGR